MLETVGKCAVKIELQEHLRRKELMKQKNLSLTNITLLYGI
jgi:hypothetical protein